MFRVVITTIKGVPVDKFVTQVNSAPIVPELDRLDRAMAAGRAPDPAPLLLVRGLGIVAPAEAPGDHR